MILETKNVVIEGPDLAGKTTLYEEIHKMSGYKWNIQDRSTLSMLVYARLYNRDVSKWRRKLWREVSNLNNRLILLRPSWNTLVRRYHDRGDEIQDLVSLRKVHDIFLEEGDKLIGLPNVIVPDTSIPWEYLSQYCCDCLHDLENISPSDMGGLIHKFVKMSLKNEVSPIEFVTIDRAPFGDADPDIMNDPDESEYYDNIVKGVFQNIDKEMRGENEYKIPQDLSTRRFIFVQESCISLVHTMFRDDVLNVHTVCRSSDVVNTFTSDIRFLHYLATIIHRKLNLDDKISVHLHVRMHSAHIREDDRTSE